MGRKKARTHTHSHTPSAAKAHLTRQILSKKKTKKAGAKRNNLLSIIWEREARASDKNFFT